MKLFYIEGNKKGASYELAPPGVSLGREEDNDIILDSEASSRYHAKLELKDGEWVLRDLGSTNGTKHNDVKISAETRLQEGDRITVGKEVLLFGTTVDAKPKIVAPPPPAAPPAPITIVPEAPPAAAVTKPEPVPSSEKPSIDIAKTDAVKEEKKSFLNFFSTKDSGPEVKKEEQKDGEKPQVEETSLGILNKMDLFAKKQDTEAGKRRHASLLFYVIVIVMAFLMVMVFLLFEKMNRESEANRKPKTVVKSNTTPLMVTYVKQISTADNIFRYELTIRDDKICAIRDDLKYHIKFKKEDKVDRDALQKLELELKETDFMNLAEQQAGVASEDKDELKTLTIAFGTNLNSIRIKNTFEPTSFKEAVRILEEFSETKLEIWTGSKTADELKAIAEDEFRNAEMLFRNYQAKDSNLRDAIRKYNLVVENLECFEPKPEMYDTAYQKAQESKKMLDDLIKALMSDAERDMRLSKYDDAKKFYLEVKAKADPKDPNYDKARKIIIKLEDILRDKKKK
ncbi:MAG TPA: hypothetical protein DCZ94_15940 [Lentisphaeria bacterium]|nr:MAG: hypothetical protein A2X48_00280 [Lentisphaerae bacterium GWF2_49_21]HBC88439.1 hypothetical protein [Lentisphaeria bacterium]